MYTKEQYEDLIQNVPFFKWVEEEGSTRLRNCVRQQFDVPLIPSPTTVIIQRIKKWWGR